MYACMYTYIRMHVCIYLFLKFSYAYSSILFHEMRSIRTTRRRSAFKFPASAYPVRRNIFQREAVVRAIRVSAGSFSLVAFAQTTLGRQLSWGGLISVQPRIINGTHRPVTRESGQAGELRHRLGRHAIASSALKGAAAISRDPVWACQ